VVQVCLGDLWPVTISLDPLLLLTMTVLAGPLRCMHIWTLLQVKPAKYVWLLRRKRNYKRKAGECSRDFCRFRLSRLSLTLVDRPCNLALRTHGIATKAPYRKSLSWPCTYSTAKSSIKVVTWCLIAWFLQQAKTGVLLHYFLQCPLDAALLDKTCALLKQSSTQNCIKIILIRHTSRLHGPFHYR
jgi:hypothetical protein